MNVDYQAIDWGTLVQRRASKNPPDQGGWNAFCTGFSGLDFFIPGTHLPLRGNGEQAWFGWPTSSACRSWHPNVFGVLTRSRRSSSSARSSRCSPTTDSSSRDRCSGACCWSTS